MNRPDSLSENNNTTDDSVAVVVDAFQEAIRRGEQPSVEDYARRYPHLADILREVLPALGVLHSPDNRLVFSESISRTSGLRHALEDKPIPTRRRRKLATGVQAALLIAFLILAGGIGWVVRDREARREEIRKALQAPLDDADHWQQQRCLPEALTAARQANDLLDRADVDQATRQQVRARLEDLERLGRVENIRLEHNSLGKDGRFSRENVDQEYREILRIFRLDLTTIAGRRGGVVSVEESAERIRSTTVAIELAAALDDWAAFRKEAKGSDDPGRKHFLRVARRADPDPWRTQIREALENEDRPALRRLASAPDVFRLPPATMSCLGSALLGDEERREEVEAFLLEAQRRHPRDFHLALNLVWFYQRHVQPPRWEQAVRFTAILVTLHPASPGTHANLGLALMNTGRLDEAIAEYREAIRLKEDYVEVYCTLGLALLQQGKFQQAVENLRLWAEVDALRKRAAG